MNQVLVVIATYRRPEYVRTCLEHVMRQTRGADRVVVVDASPDTLTREVVAQFADVEYRPNPLGRGTTATSRAIGVAGATEHIVAFIDDDAYAHPDWLECLTQPYADPSIVGVGGRADNGRPDELTEGIGEIGLLLPSGHLTGFFAADPGRTVDVDHMIGANMSLRLDAIRDAGGIRDYYPGSCLREETDISLRVRQRGGRLVYEPRAVVRHVAGTYAKGSRFDARYRFYGMRNHVVLLATVFGWRHTLPWRYLRTALTNLGWDVRSGMGSSMRLVAAREPLLRAIRTSGGAVWRVAIDVLGLVAGVFASLRPEDRARGVIRRPTP